MAAGQQRKRLNSASVVSCNLQEQYRIKKKKNLESSQHEFNMRPHISLKWDDARKKAVAKKEQIGITWRDVGPFVGDFCLGLADVFPVPQEIFGLENLMGVLSHEVWETHLSGSERKFLTQFLPRGIDVDQVVEALLTGENFLFGNPFLTWSASLCCGNTHPDAVLYQDKCFRANKKAYHAELQKYHTEFLENLKKWKDRWTRCKDPEKEIVEKMWRCRINNAENSLSSHPNESREHELEENHKATAESGSWIADEQTCVSNKETTLCLKSGESQERKGSGKPKIGNLSAAPGQGKVVGNSGKEEKLNKAYVRSADAAKYMSYFRVSKKQHQLVKKIKQSGEGIQSKSLSRVLGDIKSFNVQPYKAFEEEERKKLHEHWLQLACRDLPAALENHSKRQLQRHQWRKTLDQELAVKKKVVRDEDGEEDPETALKELGESGRKMEPASLVDLQNCKDLGEVVPHSTQPPPLQRIPSLNRPHECEPMVLDSGDCHQDILKHEMGGPIPYQISGKMNPAEEGVNPEASAKNVWQGVEIPDSCYHPTSASHGYTSSGELSLRKQHPVEEQPARMIDLETDVPEQNAGENLFGRSSDKAGPSLHLDNRSPLFSSYADQDRSELIPPFLKGQGILQTYPEKPINDLKQSGIQFLGTDSASENGQFTVQQRRRRQQQLFEERQIREKDLYMHQIMQKSMYSNGRYPTQELFSSGDTQEWAADPARTAPFQSPVNSGMLGHDWFSGDHRPHNGWSSSEASSTAGPCLGGGSSNTDGSLFSVLSQCNKLQSHSQNESTNCEPFVPARNFVSGGISGNGDMFTYTPIQSNYLSTHESTPKAIAPWMNLPHSNTGAHDSIEKPFLRSWNK